MLDFTAYEPYDFEICWVEENLKSRKKWFYAFQEYYDDNVITIDDDILYKNTMLETLLKVYRQFPEYVIARNAHLIACSEDGSVALYNDWQGMGLADKYINSPRMDLSAIGNGGILYPVHLLNNRDIFSKEIFMKICSYADDLWLKIMEVYNDMPVVLTERIWNDITVKEYQADGLFQTYNKNGGNDEQFKALLKRYPHTYKKEWIANKIFNNGRISSKQAGKIENREMK